MTFFPPIPEHGVELAQILLGLLLLGLAWARYVRSVLDRRASENLGHRFLEALGRRDLGTALGIMAAHPANPAAHVLGSGLVMHLYQRSLRAEGSGADPLPPVRLAIQRASSAMGPRLKVRLEGFATLAFLALAIGLLASLGQVMRLLASLGPRPTMSAAAGALAEALVPAVLGLVVLLVGIAVIAWMKGQERANLAGLDRLVRGMLDAFEHPDRSRPAPGRPGSEPSPASAPPGGGESR